MKILWLLDPPQKLSPRDSSLRLAREAEALGHVNSFASIANIDFFPQPVIRASTGPGSGMGEGPVPLEQFDCCFLRVDPPVGEHYLFILQLLAQAETRTHFINPPKLLAQFSSKLSLGLLAPFLAPTIASCNADALLERAHHWTKSVIKPTNLYDGVGVAVLEWSYPECIVTGKELLGQATEDFTRHVCLQKYIDLDGPETRAYYAEGKLVFAVGKETLKIDPSSGIPVDFRIIPEHQTSPDRLFRLGSCLAEIGLRFVAIDLRGDAVIDLNLISPGLVIECEEALSRNVSRELLTCLLPSP